MAKLLRRLSVLSLAGFVAGTVGFVMFAERIRHLEAKPNARADAIVVLTGDEERIATGVRLMLEGRAGRLLISGVNPFTRVPTELKRRIEGGSDQVRAALVKCCVDIGREAANTIGNADEARSWARMHGFHSLLVVTSGYHMPRGLVEFGRAMPEIQLVPYPVTAGRGLKLDSWWQHWPTLRLLAGEYVKFLGSSARLAVARVVAQPPSEPPPEAPAFSQGHSSASVSLRPGR